MLKITQNMKETPFCVYTCHQNDAQMWEILHFCLLIHKDKIYCVFYNFKTCLCCDALDLQCICQHCLPDLTSLSLVSLLVQAMKPQSEAEM